MTSSCDAQTNADLEEAVDACAPEVWSRLRAARIFMTGGTGFVGKWLVGLLLQADRDQQLGLKVSVLTRRASQYSRTHPDWAHDARLEFVEGDLLDLEATQSRFSHVVHAAFPVAAPHAGDDAAALRRLGEFGARKVCDFARAAGAERLLHVSSGAVYGAGSSPLDFSEDAADSGSPSRKPGANAYAQAKQAAEDVVRRYGPAHTSIARCFSFIGPQLLPGSGLAAAQFIEAAHKSQSIVVHGTGRDLRSYQYAGDMARWLVTILALGAAGRSYNVGSDRACPIGDLARAIADIEPSHPPVLIQNQQVSGLAGTYYVPDVRRARDELGLDNRVGLPEAIARTLAWRHLTAQELTRP